MVVACISPVTRCVIGALVSRLHTLHDIISHARRMPVHVRRCHAYIVGILRGRRLRCLRAGCPRATRGRASGAPARSAWRRHTRRLRFACRRLACGRGGSGLGPPVRRRRARAGAPGWRSRAILRRCATRRALLGQIAGALGLRLAVADDTRLALQRAGDNGAALVAGGLSLAVADGQQAATLRAGQRQRPIPDGEVAGRVVGAAVEDLGGLARLALDQLAAAVSADRAGLDHERLLECAIRIAGAGDEAPEAPAANEQRTTAFGACLVGLLNRLLHLVHLGLGASKLLAQGGVEVLEEGSPFALALLNGVEAALHIGREVDVHDLGEVLEQQLVDRLAEPGGHEAAILLLDIAAILDGTDDGHVGAGPADATLLQLFDQAGLGEACGRLSEVLVGRELAQRQRLTLRQRRQRFAVLLTRPDGGEAGELERRAGGAEDEV